MAVHRGPQQEPGAAPRGSGRGRQSEPVQRASAAADLWRSRTDSRPRSGSRRTWAYECDLSRRPGGTDRLIVPTQTTAKSALRGPRLGAMPPRRDCDGLSLQHSARRRDAVAIGRGGPARRTLEFGATARRDRTAGAARVPGVMFAFPNSVCFHGRGGRSEPQCVKRARRRARRRIRGYVLHLSTARQATAARAAPSG